MFPGQDTYLLGHVEDAADVEGSIGLVVQDVAGLVVSLRYEAVKLLVLPLADVLRVQHPQSLWRSRENRSHQLQDAGAGKQNLSNRLLCTAWECDVAQAHYHRLTNYCALWPRATPQRKLLPCNIYRVALFRPKQKGFA